MAIQTLLWKRIEEKLQSNKLEIPLWVGVQAGHLTLQTERDDAAAFLVAAIPPLGNHVAVALVPDDGATEVTRNGRELSPGLWGLMHADELEAAGCKLWVAVEATHDLANFDAAVHGADVRCFLSRARLSNGEEIVICPGTPHKVCGSIYKLKAWQLAQESARPFRCPSCGYMPSKAAWQPAVSQPDKTLESLFEIIAQSV